MFMLLGLGYDLPSLDIEEDPNPLWTQNYSANSNSSFELDFLGEGASALLVNPSSVVPFVSSRRRLVEETKTSEENSDEKNDEETFHVSITYNFRPLG
jgi:hypothetical protein